jgi:hypothetical protein
VGFRVVVVGHLVVVVGLQVVVVGLRVVVVGHLVVVVGLQVVVVTLRVVVGHLVVVVALRVVSQSDFDFELLRRIVAFAPTESRTTSTDRKSTNLFIVVCGDLDFFFCFVEI